MPELLQPGVGPRTRGGARPGEEGYILIAVLFLVALVLIGLAVAAPRMAKSIQRDKELELVHRGEQYKHAIKLYYKKFGRYPTSIDQLINTNNIRFLRKRYTDPITGKDDWRLIHLGQAKVPPLGFFGQPLSGIPGAANIGAPVSPAAGSTAGTSLSGTSAFGASAPSSFGTISENTPDSSSDSSDSDNSTSDNSSTRPSVTFTGSNPEPVAPAPGSPPAGTNGTSMGGFGKTDGSSGIGSGPTFGGGPIVGVGVPSTKASLLDYKKQTHYNKWEFVYNPIEDQMNAAGMLGAGGGNVTGTSGTTSTSPFGGSTNTSSPFGSSNSNSFGSGSSSFGSSTSGTTTPMGSSPQQ